MQRDEEKVEAAKAAWKRGDTVVLIEMSDPQAPPAGTSGRVKSVDDMGQIHVDWDLGGSLALVPGVDRFRKQDRDGDVCPKCGGGNFEGTSYREQSLPAVLVRELSCNECGAEWLETWALEDCKVAGA